MGKRTTSQRYEFRVRGVLSATLQGAFPNLDVQVQEGQTVLVRTLPDQASLFGVLAQIAALGLELLCVSRVPS